MQRGPVRSCSLLTYLPDHPLADSARPPSTYSTYTDAESPMEISARAALGLAGVGGLARPSEPTP